METTWLRTILRNRDLMWDGLVVTIQISLIAFVSAILLGFLLCILGMYVRPLKWPTRLVINFFR